MPKNCIKALLILLLELATLLSFRKPTDQTRIREKMLLEMKNARKKALLMYEQSAGGQWSPKNNISVYYISSKACASKAIFTSHFENDFENRAK